MATIRISPSWKAVQMIALFSMVISCSGNSQDSTDDQKVYIIYMGDRPKGEFSALEQHKSLLQATLGRAAQSWLYSYTRSFNGFAAKLTEDEREKIASSEGVVSVFPSTKIQLHTTRSWDFMGFPQNVQRTRTESDIIVGVLDSGIWPESKSFDDAGFGPPPKKWKGSCQSSFNFTCNNKIIGAKYYHSNETFSPSDIPSPRDTDGHGTHTASTVVGVSVCGANMYGLGAGTARGGVPSARIAVYKVCWFDGCPGADVLAAFDDAIADGVDIISVSLGGSPTDYFHDPIAIGAFHAMKNGILTVNSAGNSGPSYEPVSNISPWSLTVAASTIDRKFLSKVRLGNKKTYEGVALNTFALKKDNYPLVYGGDVPNTAGGFDRNSSTYCEPNSLDPKLVDGTIVLCEGFKAQTAAAAGATGAILYSNETRDWSSSYPLPASYVASHGYEIYDQYIIKTSKPTVTIFKSIEVNDTSAPYVVSFSSRGPNPITSNILKPDLTAPGVDILAAWSEATTETRLPEDTRVVPYNIISGTSMSCPHASGAAAYVKSFNPTWSPAAIKSALMTTATPMNAKINKDAELAYGSGHIDPLRAKAPGLVYDMGETDYVNLLCSQGYSRKDMKQVTGDSSTCVGINNATVNDFNYPALTISAAIGSSITAVFHRTVTNVCARSSNYKAIVAAPSGLSIEVRPSTLCFKSLGEKQTFSVTVTVTVKRKVLSGSLVWDDGVHQVRSPIVVHSP